MALMAGDQCLTLRSPGPTNNKVLQDMKKLRNCPVFDHITTCTELVGYVIILAPAPDILTCHATTSL